MAHLTTPFKYRRCNTAIGLLSPCAGILIVDRLAADRPK
jgi:hypothetical protein